jgi:hypothetical protein
MSSDFVPSQAELALTAKIFEKCDTKKLGIITGEAAVGVLNGTKLSAVVLGQVWAISDKENNGFLTRRGVSIALRLLGHAQRGEPVSESQLSKRKYTRLVHLSGHLGVLIFVQPGCHQMSKALHYRFFNNTLEVRLAVPNRLPQ